MAKLSMTRVGRGLYPADDLSEEDVHTLPGHVPLVVEAHTSRRSIPQLRLYWAVLQLLVKGGVTTASREALHEWVKLRLGVTEDIVLRTGEVVTVPSSVGLDSMKQEDFDIFFNAAMDLICNSLTDLGREDVLERAQALLGKPR